MDSNKVYELKESEVQKCVKVQYQNGNYQYQVYPYHIGGNFEVTMQQQEITFTEEGGISASTYSKKTLEAVLIQRKIASMQCDPPIITSVPGYLAYKPPAIPDCSIKDELVQRQEEFIIECMYPKRILPSNVKLREDKRPLSPSRIPGTKLTMRDIYGPERSPTSIRRCIRSPTPTKWKRTPESGDRSISRSRSRTPKRKQVRQRSPNMRLRSSTPRIRSPNSMTRLRSLSPKQRSQISRVRLSTSPRSPGQRLRSFSQRLGSISPRNRSISPRQRQSDSCLRSLSPWIRHSSQDFRTPSPRKKSNTKLRSPSPIKRSSSPRLRFYNSKLRHVERLRSISPKSKSPRLKSRSPRFRSPKYRSKSPHDRFRTSSPRSGRVYRSPKSKLSNRSLRSRSNSPYLRNIKSSGDRTRSPLSPLPISKELKNRIGTRKKLNFIRRSQSHDSTKLSPHSLSSSPKSTNSRSSSPKEKSISKTLKLHFRSLSPLQNSTSISEDGIDNCSLKDNSVSPSSSKSTVSSQNTDTAANILSPSENQSKPISDILTT